MQSIRLQEPAGPFMRETPDETGGELLARSRKPSQEMNQCDFYFIQLSFHAVQV